MIFDRLLIREKLNLLVLLPLLVILVLTVPLVAQPVSDARLAGRTASVVQTADGVFDVVERLQGVRLQAVAYLTGRQAPAGPFTVRAAALNAELERFGRRSGATTDPALRSAVEGVAAVQRLHTAVLDRSVTPERVISTVGTAVEGLVDALDLSRQGGVTPDAAAELAALDALLRANEAADRSGALLLLAARQPSAAQRARTVQTARSYAARDAFEVARFRQLAGPDARELLRLATTGRAAASTAALLAELPEPAAGRAPVAAGSSRRQAAPPPSRADRVPVAAQVLAAVSSQTAVRQIVGGKVVRDVLSGADRGATAARTAALAVAGVAVLLVVLVLWLSVVVGRTISRPLRRLTTAAGQVADIAQEELLRVADEDARDDAAPRLAAVAVPTEDEVGELAAAFNRVQATAALLLERQLSSRRNVSAMFASVGQRTTNLVGRQLAIIDALERDEDDPDVLATLYRLDHVSTRLRRNARSLVVLSGVADGGTGDEALALADAVRVALGSVEEYQRVRLERLPAAHLVPGAVGDVSLLLAELIENAVLFSPPRTTVEVTGTLDEQGCVLSIVDHGLGMSPERFAEENARLRRRERLDLAPTSVLGLFVVGRLCRRHGVDVTLEPTAGGGVTARVVLPARLLTDPGRLTDAALGARPGAVAGPVRERDRPAGVPVPVLAASTGALPPVTPASAGPDPAVPAVPAPVYASATLGWPSAPSVATVTPTRPPAGTPEEAVIAAPAPAVPAAPTARPAPAGGGAAPAAPVVPAEPGEQEASEPDPPSAVASEPVPPSARPSLAGLVRRRPGQHLAAMESGVPTPPAAHREDSVQPVRAPAPEQPAGVEPVPAAGPEPVPEVLPTAPRPSVGLVRRVSGEALDRLEGRLPAPAPAPAPPPAPALATPPLPAPPAPAPNDPDEVRRMLDDVDGGLRRAQRHLGTERAPGHDGTELRTGEVDAAAVLAFVEELQAGVAAAEATVAREHPTPAARPAGPPAGPPTGAPTGTPTGTDRTTHEEGQP